MWDTQKGENISGDMIQNSVVIKNTVMDELKQHLEAGDIRSAMNLIGMQTDFIGTRHPFYPDYIIGLKESCGRWIPYSKPITERAHTAMTPQVMGKFTFSDRYSGFKSPRDIFENSYFTQTDIDINLVELKRMLGDKPDPFQDDLVEFLNKCTGEWKIKHEDFPPPKPYKVILKDHNISFDYVLLGVKEVFDSTVVLSNHTQETNIQFEFEFNLQTKSLSANLAVNENYKYDYKTQLQFLNFVKTAMNKCLLSIVSLEENTELANGQLSEFEYESSFGSIDYEIEFIESIMIVESHYGSKIIVPSDVDKDSYNNLIYLSEGITSGIIEGTWSDLKAELGIIEGTRENIEKLGDNSETFSFEHSRSLTVFGKEYHIPKVVTHFQKARIKDIDKLKAKLHVLEIGDTIKVHFIPGDNNKYREEIFFM